MKSIPARLFEDYESISTYAADLIVDRCRNNPELILGLATGHSPALTYNILSQKFKVSKELVSSLHLVQLDEWIGTGSEDTASCQHYLKNHVADPWQLSQDQFLLIDGDPRHAQKEAQKLRAFLHSARLDLCILGLGRNGHLALNEPGSEVGDRTRIVDLDPISQTHSMINNSKKPITQGITIGLSEIMDSKEIILLVTGDNKRVPFQRLMDGAPVDEFPASVLSYHENWTCLVDQSSVI